MSARVVPRYHLGQHLLILAVQEDVVPPVAFVGIRLTLSALDRADHRQGEQAELAARR
ncbi:hypothetical protein [Streptomyces canus]|uniref:hypothetical protein n=1 Tax=Streptomyces canus TaxID=58343 RepID=UPI002E2D8FF9|nr:hypothetical protein [Streptomyces canus]